MSGPLTAWGWSIANLKAAAEPDHDFLVRLEPVDIPPGRIAYLLLREIYRWFGFADENIPYVSAGETDLMIDPEEIKRPRA